MSFLKLELNDYSKVTKLIKNTEHELFVSAVIEGTAPGEIFVDNKEAPLSTLILTSVCNVVAGYANNELFNAAIKKKLHFYDFITCDTAEWERNIYDIHSNVAMKKYKRRYYEFNQMTYPNFLDSLDGQNILEYVYLDTLDNIQYENKEKVIDWFEFNNIEEFKDYCLGAYIRTDDKIVSWCLVDCIVGNKIEIGITTDRDFRRKGLGSIVLAATVNECISNGIKEIGWHCVDSNVGSYTIAENIGFKKVREYYSFTSYPPIENVTDLNNEQWSSWASYYEKMNKVEPKYHMLAAECWAKANDVQKTIENIQWLVDSGEKAFVKDYYEEEFESLINNDQWNIYKKELAILHSINLK